MKGVLISIQPKHIANILNLKKIFEIRKNAPKLKPPFKCYIYCTLGGPSLVVEEINGKSIYSLKKNNDYRRLNGKIIAEFTCDMISKLNNVRFYNAYKKRKEISEKENASVADANALNDEFYWGACISYQELYEYAGDKDIYIWHISKLKIYNTPKQLEDFSKPIKNCFGECKHCINFNWNSYEEQSFSKGVCKFDENEKYSISKAPQSWCYVNCNEVKNVLCNLVQE